MQVSNNSPTTPPLITLETCIYYLFYFINILSSGLVKSRKRKLSDLYYLTRYQTYPINKDSVAQDEDSLMAFLEKNDLERYEDPAEEN